MGLNIGKLVRDKIPSIIEERGERAVFRIASDSEMIMRLNLKLKEELDELVSSLTLERQEEELADLLEVIDAYTKTIGSTKTKINNIKKKKAAKRGRFRDKIFLISVEEPLTEEEKKDREEYDQLVETLQRARHASSTLTVTVKK